MSRGKKNRRGGRGTLGAAPAGSARRWRRSGVLAVVAAAGVLAGGYVVLSPSPRQAPAAPPAAVGGELEKIPFGGAQAYEYLKQICSLGPRYSGSPGMTAQQKMLTEHFQQLGAQVTRQEFRARHPLTGQAVPMTNLVIQWHPERKERILLGAHYDTRPRPDRDPRNPRGRFLGANDGASGVALLMELGKAMPKFENRYGVDFVLFDGEELVYQQGDPYCLGSQYFAQKYAADPPPYKYRWAVVLDMIGDAHLRIPQERNSIEWPDSRPLVEEIWATAARLGVKEFIPRPTRDGILDDHVMLHNVGGIPACDIIDLDYPAWHTEADMPAQCSPLSLAKVGWVVQEWLKGLK